MERAEQAELSYREFLLTLLETEVKGRNERRRKRNLSAAHFPPNVKRLEEFDPNELESGITLTQIRQLKELNWLDAFGNLVFAGPPGLGKTMLAVGLGMEAIQAGYTVCFERMSNFVKILDLTLGKNSLPYTEKSAYLTMERTAYHGEKKLLTV